MSKMLSTAILAATFALVSTPSTAATTLNFASECGGVCAAYGTVSQSFGDVAGVLDVSYRSVASSGSTTTAGAAYTWSSGYGDLSSAIWGTQNGALEIAFNLLAPNKQITLNSVTFAAYSGNIVQTQFAIYSLGSAGGFFLPLLPSGSLTSLGSGHETWSPNFSSTSGFVLHFGPDGFNSGIGELSFTVSDVAAVAAVPEPATWLSMIVGFGLIGAAARRRTARPAIAIV